MDAIRCSRSFTVLEKSVVLIGLNLVASREYDIAKRLCLIQMAKLSTQDLTAQFGPEYIMYQKFNQARPLIWQNLLLEIQNFLLYRDKLTDSFFRQL